MDKRIQGKIITDEQIEYWSAEAKKGFDVKTLQQKGRGRPGRGAMPSQVVAIRFTPTELAKLDAQAAALHLSRSEFIREMIFV